MKREALFEKSEVRVGERKLETKGAWLGCVSYQQNYLEFILKISKLVLQLQLPIMALQAFKIYFRVQLRSISKTRPRRRLIGMAYINKILQYLLASLSLNTFLSVRLNIKYRSNLAAISSSNTISSNHFLLTKQRSIMLRPHCAIMQNKICPVYSERPLALFLS